jgi:hypothetical protein
LPFTSALAWLYVAPANSHLELPTLQVAPANSLGVTFLYCAMHF